jgi:hypothetical protein
MHRILMNPFSPQMHVLIQLLEAASFAGGIYYHLQAKMNWEAVMNRNWFHIIGGYITVGLFALNLLMGYFVRHHIGERKNVIHEHHSPLHRRTPVI